MCDSLRRIDLALAVAHAAQHRKRSDGIAQSPSDLLEQTLLFARPNAHVRALVQTEQVALVALCLDRHRDLRANGETVGCRRRNLEVVVGTEQNRARRRLCRLENGGDLGVRGQFFFERERPGELRTRVLHDGSPRWGSRVAWVDDPGSIAGKDLERRLEHLAHHPVEFIGSLDGAVDAIHRLEKPQVRPVFLLGIPQIGDVDHEADHALGLAFGVEQHAAFRPQPVHGAVVLGDSILGRDIARLVRTFERELCRRPVIGIDQLLPALKRSIERARLLAIHRFELGRPAVFALAGADEPIEGHRACRFLCKVEHFLLRAQFGLDALLLGVVPPDAAVADEASG